MSLGSRNDYLGGHVLVTETNGFLWRQKQQEISCHFTETLGQGLTAWVLTGICKSLPVKS